ncbi:MAG: glucose-6-phosphate dehydrogenase [Sedimentisphaerales bacterium]|nr:glucose-6-phosphate dehydrogenase [Sedimentisphaerales bacterium]
MEKIRPSVKDQQMLCVESPPPDCGIVVFGASGDLSKRKLIPALGNLFKRGLLSRAFFCLGCGRKKYSDDDFRQIAAQAIEDISPALSDSQKSDFLACFHYINGDYGDENFYKNLSQTLAELDKKQGKSPGRVFYLSLPPTLYSTVSQNLGKAGLNNSSKDSFTRLIVEKPFGRDLASAVELNDCISKWFTEEQIYRIDHYLGKETVQNILMFRFANSIFEPLWNRNYIDHIQITIAESLGIESRGGYYDKSGALRDMFVNHMLSMVCLVAMEPPASFASEHIRNEKVQLLQSIRPFKLEPWNEDIVKGQYSAGEINGQKVPAYRQEADVANGSNTETYVASRLWVDNWRWQGVPFYLRTGKRLSKRVTEIAVTFKKVPHVMFKSAGIEQLPANVLIMKIQPQEGISLFFEAKRPGAKLCIGTLEMDFNYAEVFSAESHDAYERLLLDCMVGDQTLFTRIDDVKLTWQLIDNILSAWQQEDSTPHFYPAGAQTFPQADGLIQKDGRSWRPISQM